MTDVIGIARIMRPRSMSRELSGTIREILGTCQSVGCTVDGESPHDLIDKVQKTLWLRQHSAHRSGTVPTCVRVSSTIPLLHFYAFVPGSKA